MTDKQKIIFDFVRENGSITKKTAVDKIGGSYFINASKHVGDVLSRMVKSGLLKRVKNGVFELGVRTNKNTVNENQLDLFNPTE